LNGLQLDPNDGRDVPLVLKRYPDFKSVAERRRALPDITATVADLIRSHGEKVAATIGELEAIEADTPGWRFRLEEVEPFEPIHAVSEGLRGGVNTWDVRVTATYRVVWERTEDRLANFDQESTP
jgi:hypothetical protein